MSHRKMEVPDEEQDGSNFDEQAEQELQETFVTGIGRFDLTRFWEVLLRPLKSRFHWSRDRSDDEGGG